jgi:hypothetical protein
VNVDFSDDAANTVMSPVTLGVDDELPVVEAVLELEFEHPATITAAVSAAAAVPRMRFMRFLLAFR